MTERQFIHQIVVLSDELNTSKNSSAILLQQPLEEPSRPEWNIDNSLPPPTEIQRVISILQRDMAPGSDGLPPALFKRGGEVLVNCLTTILQKIWNDNRIPAELSSSTVIPVF
ncbi:hypothetical protein CLF_106757 [Clonorchis sinensis]|uniref:Uncharacterized protein n=1 Tax=Clonorchis sinensis TaxID=79923 RepID=H2KTY0_CLOSI|nr:hypothetical protein CLF_106757 [Clonorchis sinensis]